MPPALRVKASGQRPGRWPPNAASSGLRATTSVPISRTASSMRTLISWVDRALGMRPKVASFRARNTTDSPQPASLCGNDGPGGQPVR